MRLFVFARHAESALNVERRVNGDPSVPVPLTARGREQASLLGVQLAALPLDACVTTRFERTRETARIALEERPLPLREEPLLDDIAVGELEGSTIDDYRAWKRSRSRHDAFPGGESLDDAAARYALAFRGLVALDARAVLVVCHEIPIRYLANAAAGARSLEGPVHQVPNATPFLFAADALERAAARIEELVAQSH